MQHQIAVAVIDQRFGVEIAGRVVFRRQDELAALVQFARDTDDAAAIVQRMRRAWIQRKAGQPLSFQSACRVFYDPRRGTAASLIEQAGLVKTRVGGAEVSERNPNFVVAASGATARDVLALIDLIQTKVREHCGVQLEQDLLVW